MMHLHIGVAKKPGQAASSAGFSQRRLSFSPLIKLVNEPFMMIIRTL
jgi:hypothetical protein